MRTPIGTISRLAVAFVVAIAVAIVTGLLIPGTVGFWIEVAGWGILAVMILLKIGVQTTTTSGTDVRSPRNF